MGKRDCAKAKVAQIKSSTEECAESTGQHTNDVVVKGVQIGFRKEECVLGMGQSATYAAVKDVPIGPS